MSRIVVKNLPKTITEAKLHKHFSRKGTITDLQLKYNENGKFRGFAFIGFKDEGDAKQAIQDFDKTFIATSKITVEECANLGEQKPARSKLKKSTNSLINIVSTKKSEGNHDTNKKADKKVKKKRENNGIPEESIRLLEKYKEDPQFREYVEVHPNLKQIVDSINDAESKGVTVDDTKEDSAIGSDDSDAENESEKAANKQISDKDYMEQLKKNKKKEKSPKNIELFVVKLKGLPYKCKKKDIKEFFKPNIPFSIRVPRQVPGIAYAGFKTEGNLFKALKKDRSFIGGKQITVKRYVEKGKDTSNENNKKKPKWESQEKSLEENEEGIGESGSIFFRNLAYTVTKEDIEDLFSKYGPIAELNLPLDPINRRVKGFGTVTYVMPEHAVRAFGELDGIAFQGRMLHLLPGKQKETQKHEDLEETTNFKKKKQAKQKSQAGSSHNWNSLFIDHDAVARVIASAYDVTRQQVLDPHGGSTAARLALAETKIVQETKQYLEKEGVILDAFGKDNVKRSSRIILVKNLPAQTQVKEITNIFAKYGLINRIVVPPSGISALVEFENSIEAEKAFYDTAYSQFKNKALFLEWAPENCLTQKTQKDKPVNDKSKKVEEEAAQETVAEMGSVNQETTEKGGAPEEDEEEPEPDTTLFVKNLNFKTTDEDLKKHFESCGRINYATVATKKDKSDPSKRLSMGYGFVRYYYEKSADNALRTLQGSTLDGKTLELKRSERTLKSDLVAHSRKPVKITKQNGTKILVKNVPFQANHKDLMEIFRTFGEVKSLRLPKKLRDAESGHRGFAFVEYTTKSDAKSAFEALCQSTHLFGRRLVLEWAEAEENVEEIRKRTAAHFKPHEEVRSKKSVFRLEEEA